MNCNSPEIGNRLAALADLLLKNGSGFSDFLSVRQQGTDLTLLSAAEPAAVDLLLAVSTSCLVPIDDFELRCELNDLVIFAAKDHVTPLRMALMEHQLAVFNLAGKLVSHRAINPAFRYGEHDSLLQHLFLARTQKRQFASSLQAMAPGQREITAFFFTRTLKILLPGETTPSRVLMPFVDYCNHHPLAPPYMPLGPADSIQAVGIVSAKMITGSDETFVSYGRDSDALDIYLNYHFVMPDDATPFVRSAPVTVDFGSLGSLDIEAGRPINYAGPLDIEDQDLAHSMPAFEFSGPSRLRAAHLQIDLAGRTPVTRRVLALLIRKLSNGIETLQLEQLTREAERQVLAVNLNFYRTLLRLANDRTRSTTKVDPVISACSVVAEVQLRKLAQYRDRWGIT